MYWLENVVPSDSDQRFDSLCIFSPKQEDKASTFYWQGLDGRLGQILPAFLRMRVGFMSSHCQSSIEQKNPLITPLQSSFSGYHVKLTGQQRLHMDFIFYRFCPRLLLNQFTVHPVGSLMQRLLEATTSSVSSGGSLTVCPYSMLPCNSRMDFPYRGLIARVRKYYDWMHSVRAGGLVACWGSQKVV